MGSFFNRQSHNYLILVFFKANDVLFKVQTAEKGDTDLLWYPQQLDTLVLKLLLILVILFYMCK